MRKSHTGNTQKLAGGNSNIFGIFTPKIGEIIQFDEHIFQMGWFNHQLENHKRVLEEFHWSNKNHDSPGQDALNIASFSSLKIQKPTVGESVFFAMVVWWLFMPPLLGSKIFLRASDFPPVSDVVSIVPSSVNMAVILGMGNPLLDISAEVGQDHSKRSEVVGSLF